MHTSSFLHNDLKPSTRAKNLLIAPHRLPRIYIMTLAATLYVWEEYFGLNREILQFAYGYIRTCLNMAFWRRKASLWAVVRAAELISFGFIGWWSSAPILCFPPFLCLRYDRISQKSNMWQHAEMEYHIWNIWHEISHNGCWSEMLEMTDGAFVHSMCEKTEGWTKILRSI